MQIKEQTFYKILPNGVKIVLRQTDSAVAYVGIMVGAGTRDEVPEVNGMAHYIEHCVFKGTERRTAREIISQIEGIGGEVNAYTTKEETTFYAATPVEHLRHTFRLIADMVLHPTFPKKETDKELGVILDEIESYNDSPSELIYDDFEALVFEGESLAQPILGTRKSLRRVSKSPEVAKQWMSEQYRPERMVVFVQGRTTMASVEKMAHEMMGDGIWNMEYGKCNMENGKCNMEGEEKGDNSGTGDPRTTVGRPSVDPRVVVGADGKVDLFPNRTNRTVSYKKHTHQTHVMMGSRAYALGHERRLCAYLLNNILGGGSLNSRLNLSLREKRGLVYTVESTYTPLSDTGYWCVYFACDEKDKEECIRLVKAELRKLSEQPLSEAQLRRALIQLRGQMAISAENQESNALSMAKQMLYFGEAPTWEETYRLLCHITPEMLQETARELYDENGLFMLSYE